MSKQNEQAIRNSIALWLIKYRNAEDLKQWEMAAKLQVTRSCYSKFEARVRKPDLPTLILIAELIGISMRELTGVCATMSHS